MTNTTPEMKEYAVEAGLLERDMPPANHPLFENDADVRSLGDLVDARIEGGATDAKPGDNLSESSTGKTAFDPLDDEDSYLTRADFTDSMLSDDPDSEAGDDAEEFLTGAELDRSPDITGTVGGLMRGSSTHLPQDLGADGFQIIEPEDAGDLRADALMEENEDEDGGRITLTTTGKTMSAEDALDGTRRLT
ncbi:MAG: hypothetical protein H7Y38_00725 [Armatimonadetes bacterium]|nr:hypothetical protein [Armatimonadota bacterium]